MKIAFMENEFWYGTCVKYGMQMPIGPETELELDFRQNPTPNQAMPLLVSTKGRYLWNEAGFCLKAANGILEAEDTCELGETKGHLREAYLAAMKKHFPFHKMPAKELFQMPIYNSWIELTFDQNEKDIMNYAENILKHGMPAGVLMIDDGWSECYGDWRFHSGKFPEPEKMLERLHEMGFKVMVWVCPYITADSVAYREAEREGILICTEDEDPYIAKWWNGYSAVLDLSNPKAEEWLHRQLENLCAIGVDGFKFDAGDSIYYREDNVTYRKITPDEQSQKWAAFGEKYPFNEFRVTFRAGGKALLQRLCDKEHSWGETGIASLIPDTLLQGITGHPFGCPDMVGGGEYLNFQNMEHSGLDEELFVRHCEIACLMPAIQFSAAPFRVLTNENFKSIQKSLLVREKYLPYIMEQLEESSCSGEPAIRYMSYEFPEEGLEEVTDQFMLGSRYLVAPVYEKGKTGREVWIPKGKWIYQGKELISEGEKKYYESEPGVPLIFERIKK